MRFWLSRNEKDQLVIGSGDKEILLFLVYNKELAKAILAHFNNTSTINEALEEKYPWGYQSEDKEP